MEGRVAGGGAVDQKLKKATGQGLTDFFGRKCAFPLALSGAILTMQTAVNEPAGLASSWKATAPEASNKGVYNGQKR